MELPRFQRVLIAVLLYIMPGAIVSAATMSAATMSAATMERISVASSGTQGNDDSTSFKSNISADGRYAVFSSYATNLVSNDTNGSRDVFIYDRSTDLIQRISVNASGSQGNNDSYYPSISADGRYIAYNSWASNLVAGDSNDTSDIFVYDRYTGGTDRISVASNGSEANGDGSYYPTISGNGQLVVFFSYASNLVDDDNNAQPDVFVHDRSSGVTERVSIASDGTEGNGPSYESAISSDGRYIAFLSRANNLVDGDPGGLNDIFIRDRQAGTTELVSFPYFGDVANGASDEPAISADGRYITYYSIASNLVSSDNNGTPDFFLYDRDTGTTELISVATDGSQGTDGSINYFSYSDISDDGRYVTFSTDANNLVNGDTDSEWDVFVRDRYQGLTERISVNSSGIAGNGESTHPCMSSDGQLVLYLSYASNLVSGDSNEASDIFIYDINATTPDPDPNPDNDGSIVAATTVIEPVDLNTQADSSAEATNIFDFAIIDNGSSDGLNLNVSQMIFHLSGSSTDTDRSKVIWRLNGPDVSNVQGVYSAATDTVTFSGLSVYVADGSFEIYTVNAYYRDNTGLTEGRTFVLSFDGDTDFTVGADGTQFGSTSPITNGSGTEIEVEATHLFFSTQPANSVSGSVLGTQPVVMALDSFGNIDTDFTETVTVTESSEGDLIGSSTAAVYGVATFTSLTYTATVDGQSFILTANDQDGIGSNLSGVDSNMVVSDVVATKLVFDTQPDPLGIESGQMTTLTVVPVVSARDANDIVDSDHSTGVTLSEAFGRGYAIMYADNDADGSIATVTSVPDSGVAPFTGMQLGYTASGGATEYFALQARSGGLTIANSNAFVVSSYDSDADVVAGVGVAEPVILPSMANSPSAAVNVLDFSIVDGGTSDSKNTIVNGITLHVSGTLDASKLTYLLNGPDAVNVIGTYSQESSTILFSELALTVTNGSSETYTVSAYFNYSSGLTERQTLVLSTDGDTDFSLGSGSTRMGGTSAVSNGSGSPVGITATRLVYAQEPGSSVSGIALSPQPVVVALDSYGNTDIDFAETITMSENAGGWLSGTTSVNAVNGIAVFSGLTYQATSDQQSFTLTATDTAFNGLLATASSTLTSDVVATQLVFDTQPAPLLTTSGERLVFSSVPVVAARDANGLLDTDFNTVVTLTEGVENSGSVTLLTGSGDLDIDTSTVTVAAYNGRATFNGLSFTYTAASADDSILLKASDNNAITSDGYSTLLEVNIRPEVGEATGTFGPFSIAEDIKTALNSADLQFIDVDNDVLTLTITVTRGQLFCSEGDGTVDGVTIEGSGGNNGSQNMTLFGTAGALTRFFDSQRLAYKTALNDTEKATLTLTLNDGIINAETPLTELLTIIAVNDAPVIQGVPQTSVAEDSSYSFIPGVTDVEGDQLTFGIINKPVWASFDTTTGALQGTPVNADVGITSDIVISVYDGTDSSFLNAFAIEVVNVNDPPTISGTPATSVAQDSAYRFIPTAGDIDGDTLAFGISNKPAWASFNAETGVLTGTPDNDDVGTTSNIVIGVDDGTEAVLLDPFAIEVINVNDAPVINGNPAISAAEDTQYSFTPIAEDIDGDALAFGISNKPAWASFNAETGALTGTPGNDDVGTTSNIVIGVYDGTVATYLDAFAIEVVNVNDTPVIGGTPDPLVAEDSAYSFTPIANDIDGDVLTFAISNKPVWANFTTTTGALTGTPENGDVGTTSNIVISVSDGIETVSLGAFDIEVINVNDAPTIDGEPIVTVDEDSVYNFTPSGDDVDGDALTFSINNKPEWASFNTTTGALTGEPANDDVGITYNIRISVTDGAETASLDAFSLEVINTNDTPVISGIPGTKAVQNSEYDFIPDADDIDGDELVFSIANKPGWISFNTSTGEMTGTPTNDDVGSTGDIILSVSDGIEVVSLPAFVIIVANINDAPVIDGIPETTVVEDTVYSFTPYADDIDNDPLTFSIQNAPDWADFDTETGTLTGTPGDYDVTVYPDITISVSDGLETASLDAFDIEVINVNDAPTIGGTPVIKAVQDIAYRFIPDAGDVDGDNLTFSISGKPEWADFSSETGVLAGTPTNDDIGVTEEILISVSDGEETVSLPPFAITVANVNDSPIIGGVPETSVLEDTSYTFAPYADDIDGDTLTFSISNKPDWASFNPATGLLTGIPGDDDVGITSNIVISVSDGMETVSLGAFNIDVVNVNDAPVIIGLPATKAVEDIAYSFTPNADDADGDMLTFSILNQPEWTDFNPVTGSLTGIPENEDVGESDSILISVTDGEEVSYLASFVIEVINTNDAPVISGTPEAGIAEDSTYSFTPYAEDIDGDTLTFSIINQPDWTQFSTETGALTGTPDNDDVGTTSNIVIGVDDGTEAVLLDPFAIEVINVNDAPVINGNPAISVAEDTQYSFTPIAEDIDGDALAFGISNKPAWASFNAETGALTGTPGNDDVGTTSNIIIGVYDGTVATYLDAFAIEVVNVNDTPVIGGTPDPLVAEDSAYSFTPIANDIDGDVLTFAISNKPVWANFTTTTGALTGTPENGDVGTTSNIVISVSDGIETVSLGVFDIEVINVNDAPTIDGEPIVTVDEDSVYNFTPSGDDVDGDALTFSINNKPEWASFNTTTGALTGEPANDDVGITYNIRISVTDGAETASLDAFSLEVINTNDTPVISGIPGTKAVQNSEYDFIPDADDIDGDELVFSIANKPGWISFNTSTGEITGTPTNDDVGSTGDIILSVSDGIEVVSLPAFVITVANINDAPVIDGIPETTVVEDTVYSFTPYADDIDNDPLTFSIQNAPDWADFDTETGTLTGTPGDYDVTVYPDITISVSDGLETASLDAFSIEVINVNDAPTIGGTPVIKAVQDIAYRFIPDAGDVDGDNLIFSISGKPEWADFSSETGDIGRNTDKR